MKNYDLIILASTNDYVAVFKPHGIAVVGGHGVPRPTLLDLVRDKFGQNIFPVHRLDRVTAGITLFARSSFARFAFENAFKKRLVTKLYYAIVEGKLTFKQTTVNAPLKRVDNNNKKGPQARQIIDNEGEKAQTKFRLLENLGPDLWLIEANPISGRMHQIRAHLMHLNLAIRGDKLYGAQSRYPDQRIALLAVYLSLPGPRGGKITIDAHKYFRKSDYL